MVELFVVLYIVSCFIFGVITAKIASSKNRPDGGGGYFFLGFFFNVIGIAVALFLSKRPGKNELFRKCPMCAEQVKIEARKCKHCGHVISDSELINTLDRVIRTGNISKAYFAIQHLSNIDDPDVIPVVKKALELANKCDIEYKYLAELKRDSAAILRSLNTKYGDT